MATFDTDQEVIASKLPANNRYGQNGYLGPSSFDPSDPKNIVTSGFLPQVTVPGDSQQTRTVSAEQYPAAKGMQDAPKAAMPTSAPKAKGPATQPISHRASPPKQNRSFQRR